MQVCSILCRRPKIITVPHWFLFSARDFTCELCSTRKPRHNVITSSRQINLSISHTQEQAPLRDSKGSSGNSFGCPCYSLFTGQCRAKKGEAARCARRPLGRADPRAPWKGTEFERHCSGTGREETRQACGSAGEKSRSSARHVDGSTLR